MKKLILFILLLFTLTTCKAPKQNIFTKQKATIVQVDAGTYDVEIYIVVSKDTNKAREAIDTIIDEKFSFENAEAETIYTEYSPIVVWLQEIPNTPEQYATLNHELLHVTVEIMRYCGMSLTEDTEEAYAYELGYISKKVLEEFRKIKQE